MRIPLASALILGAVVCGAGITWWVYKAKANEHNLAKTAVLSRTRAEQGDANAQFQVGVMYYQGKGVRQDHTEAFRWYGKSAEQGYANAQYNLCDLYYRGDGVPQDLAEAFRWCRRAADQNSVKAQYVLGYMYYDGKGVPRDYTEAIRWYRKSAEQGYDRAQYDLGYLYYYGEGVPQDRAEANRLFHAAAGQGNEDAQRVLGLRGRRLSTSSKITLSITFAGSLWFLISSLRPGRSVLDVQNGTMALTGLLGLSTGGLDLCWDLYNGLLQPPLLAAFYFARHLLRGVLLAMLLSILFSKSAKVVLAMSGTSFVVFNIFAIAYYDLRHLPPVCLFTLANGFFFGMVITSAILFWLDGRRNRGDQNGGNTVAGRGSTSESGREPRGDLGTLELPRRRKCGFLARSRRASEAASGSE